MAIIRQLRGQVPSTHLYNHSHLKIWVCVDWVSRPVLAYPSGDASSKVTSEKCSNGVIQGVQHLIFRNEVLRLNPTSLLTPATTHKWRYRTTCIWEDLDIARREDGTLLVRILLAQPFLKTTGSLLKKWNTELPDDPRIIILGMIQNNGYQIIQESCGLMSNKTQLTAAKIRKPVKCLSYEFIARDSSQLFRDAPKPHLRILYKKCPRNCYSLETPRDQTQGTCDHLVTVSQSFLKPWTKRVCKVILFRCLCRGKTEQKQKHNCKHAAKWFFSAFTSCEMFTNENIKHSFKKFLSAVLGGKTMKYYSSCILNTNAW
jgi:hypothetical protein